MRRFLCLSLVVIGFGLAAMVAGCGPAGGKAPAKTTPPSGVEPQKHAEMPKHAESGANSPTEGLAELSEADRALAEKQKICPVSGELLGSMGKPVKVTVKGKTVFLCCERCESKITKDPDKYLAKLEAADKK